MTHADAIAALIIADLTDTNLGRVRRTMESGYLLANLRGTVRRMERRGFAHGDVVRETMTTHRAGHGYAFRPVRRLNAADRVAIVDALNAAGFPASVFRAPAGFMITFAA